MRPPAGAARAEQAPRARSRPPLEEALHPRHGFHRFKGGRSETTLRTNRCNTSQLYCHRCEWHYKNDRAGKQRYEDHIAECDPWKLERPEARREVYLPERGPSGLPSISFRQYHALVDVPF